MRRVSLFLTTLVLAALVLAACGGQETSTSVPSTNVPPVTVEVTNTSESLPTEAPTSASDMTSTPSVPVTGENSPSRVSNLIGTSVCGMDGTELGTVQDLVVDFDQTLVSYVIVDASGRAVAVPWTSFDMSSMSGTGTGTGTGTGLETSTPESGTGTGLETSTPSTGTGLETSTPSTGAGLETSTPESATVATATSSSDTGTGTGTGTNTQNCLALTVDNDTFNNAPDFDTSTLPAQGQAAPGWDASINDYWMNPGAGSTGALATNTPSSSTGLATDTPAAGTSATAMPNETATSTTSGTGAGTGSGLTIGAQQMQGVMLASDILGATVTVNPQGSGTGTTAETSTPEAGAVSTDTPAASTSDTATPESSTGTGTGDFSTGTVEDMIVEPQTGDMQYLVVSFGTQDQWIPIPVGFLRWDSTTNGFVLMVNGNALQNAPTFTPDQFPDTSMSGWDQEFSTYWQSNGGMGTGSGTGTGGVSVSTATTAP